MVTLTTLLTGFYLSKVKGSLPSEKIIVVLACQTVLYLYLGEKKKKIWDVPLTMFCVKANVKMEQWRKIEDDVQKRQCM